MGASNRPTLLNIKEGGEKNPTLLKKVGPPTKLGGIARGSIDQLCVERRKFPVFRRKGERDSGALGSGALSTVRTCSNFKDPKFGHISAILGRRFFEPDTYKLTLGIRRSLLSGASLLLAISVPYLYAEIMRVLCYIHSKDVQNQSVPFVVLPGGKKGRKSLVSADPSSKKMWSFVFRGYMPTSI